VALDIGAAELTRRLSQRLDAAAVLSGYSRLVIDCNRQPGNPTSIPEVSDGIVVSGNTDLSDGDAETRLEEVFWPYHHTVTNMVAQLWRHGPPPAVVAIHTFTHYFNGVQRPWQIGVLWNHDPRIAIPLVSWLTDHHDLCVGDNEPYSGREVGFTLDRHAGAAGLPHVCLEVRQDTLRSPSDFDCWTHVIGEALEVVLSNASLHAVEHY
jgi:predicted N-formylglutamate amidohydrolase